MGGNAMADQESCAGVGHAPTSNFGCWGAGLRTKSDWRDMRNVANAPAVCHEYTAGAIVFNNLDPGFCYRAVIETRRAMWHEHRIGQGAWPKGCPKTDKRMPLASFFCNVPYGVYL